MLERFWAGAGGRLTAAEADLLEKLLALPDNDLLELVMGRAQAADAAMGPMLEKLRRA